jgi:hypothetical protein
LLRREGWRVNAKRVWRLYREMGLQLRSKTPKRRVKARLREGRADASAANEVWAMDFVHDQLFDGRKIRVLTIIDTFTRLSPAIDVRQSYRGGGQIVHDHDVTWPQLGNERLFDIGEKGVTVHRTVEDHGRSDAVVTQPGAEGGGFPMAVGHGGAASLAPGHTTIEARHLGVRGGLVDDDDPGRIEVELSFKPRLARRVHRAAARFGGMRRRFLRVILRRLKNRQSVPMATATPRSFSRSVTLRRRPR